jgi:beta-phosphoglucomutase
VSASSSFNGFATIIKAQEVGVLFDFDGTLVDSMVDHFSAWRLALLHYGVNCDSKDYYPLEGMRVLEVAEILTRGRALGPLALREIVALKESIYRQNASFRLYPGVDEITRKLRASNVPMAIVTAGGRERVMSTTPESFLSRFTSIITGESTTRGKPYPDPFLTGAAELGIPINQCIAVENAPLGVASAKGAGAYTIAVCSTVTRDRLRRADSVLDSINQLLDADVFKILLSGRPSSA